MRKSRVSNKTSKSGQGLAILRGNTGPSQVGIEGIEETVYEDKDDVLSGEGDPRTSSFKEETVHNSSSITRDKQPIAADKRPQSSQQFELVPNQSIHMRTMSAKQQSSIQTIQSI